MGKYTQPMLEKQWMLSVESSESFSDGHLPQLSDLLIFCLL